MNQRTIQKTTLYYICGSVLAVVVFFGAAELAVRTISLVSGKGFTLALAELDAHDEGITRIYRWHPFTGITFQPGIQFEGSDPSGRQKARLFVDRHGFLANNQSLSINKQANELRIATIGGSTTANIALAYEHNWPGRLGLISQQVFPDNKVVVINAGVPGFDTAQSISNLALRVMPFKPDVVVIYHAYNDLKAIRHTVPFQPDYSHIHQRPYGHHERPTFLVRWLNNSMVYVRTRNKYRKMKQQQTRIDTVLQKDRVSDIPLAAEQTFAQHLRTLIAIARSGGAKVVLSSFATLHDPKKNYNKSQVTETLTPLQKREFYNLLHFTPGLTIEGIFKGIERYNAILNKVAEEEQTAWVDNANGIPHGDKYFIDRVHFSADGAALMAQNLLPAVV
ncbi:MAG: SGNH/GDSL hydrolase family protein, partial [Acidiferrobacterales bacterium]